MYSVNSNDAQLKIGLATLKEREKDSSKQHIKDFTELGIRLKYQYEDNKKYVETIILPHSTTNPNPSSLEEATSYKPDLSSFFRELAALQQKLTTWQDELLVREIQITREKEQLKGQRNDLIQKSNLIIEQVNGLRGEKEKANQKMFDAERLKKAAENQLEQAETIMSEVRLKQAELEEREQKVIKFEAILAIEQDKFATEKEYLRKRVGTLR